MEKVIHEFRIIETDDGFRIEIKGDKERMREFVEQMDPRNWGPWRAWGRRRGRRGFGSKMFFGFGAHPWAWWGPCHEEEEEAEEETD